MRKLNLILLAFPFTNIQAMNAGDDGVLDISGIRDWIESLLRKKHLDCNLS